jgi:hypothetical protein
MRRSYSSTCLNVSLPSPLFYPNHAWRFRSRLKFTRLFYYSFLSLGATAQGELWPPEQFSFYGVRLLASRPTPNLEDQSVPLCLADLSSMGDPTSCYATAGIALRVSGALKPHHHDKVETLSVGYFTIE